MGEVGTLCSGLPGCCCGRGQDGGGGSLCTWDMAVEGGIALALLETMVCACQEVLLTEIGQRLHGERRGGGEMEHQRFFLLHAQLKEQYIVG